LKRDSIALRINLELKEEWATFTVVMPVDCFELVVLARSRMEDEGIVFSDREPLAMGKVVELLAAEYLGSS
jgi:hypothetical protein